MTTEIMITDGIKQQVITRLATINSAISILNLTKGKPANVGVEEVLTLAERIEHWAWRDLLGERADTRAPEKPVPSKTERLTNPALPTPPAKTEPQPPAKDDRPRSSGDGQRPGEASEKQINAIFAIGKSKGHSSEEITSWVKKRFRKDVDTLTSREASKAIGDLQAL